MSHIMLNTNERVSAIQKSDSHYFRKWVFERIGQFTEEQREQSPAAFVGSTPVANVMQILHKDMEVVWKKITVHKAINTLYNQNHIKMYWEPRKCGIKCLVRLRLFSIWYLLPKKKKEKQ